MRNRKHDFMLSALHLLNIALMTLPFTGCSTVPLAQRMTDAVGTAIFSGSAAAGTGFAFLVPTWVRCPTGNG